MRESRKSTRSFPVFLILIAGAALVLRLYKLTANQLWLDEVHSIFIADSSLPVLIEKLRNDGHPPLYFVLMLVWKSVFGESEFSVRALSVALGMTSLLAVCWLGTIIFNKRVGLAGMFITAINPLHVYYSQEARMYVLLMLLATLSCGFLWLALEQPTRRRYWWAYALASTCMVYTHVLGWFVLPTGVIFVLLQKKLRWYLGRLLIYQGIVLIAFLPWIPFAVRQAEQAGQWVRQWWAATPPLLAIPKTLECLGAGGNYPAYLRSFHVSPVRFLSYAVFALLGAAALVRYRDRSLSKNAQGVGAAKLYLVLSLFVPIALPYAISFVKPIYLVGRSDLYVLPFYSLLIAGGLMKMGRLVWPGIMTLALLATYSLSQYYTIPTTAVDKETVHYLSKEARGDVVVIAGLRLLPIEYYMRRESLRFPVIAYPRSMRAHPGWLDYRQTEEELVQDAIQITVEAIEQSSPGRPVWLIMLPFDSLDEALSDRIERPLLKQFERHFIILNADEKLGIIRLRQR